MERAVDIWSSGKDFSNNESAELLVTRKEEQDTGISGTKKKNLAWVHVVAAGTVCLHDGKISSRST